MRDIMRRPLPKPYERTPLQALLASFGCLNDDERVAAAAAFNDIFGPASWRSGPSYKIVREEGDHA